MTCLLAAMWLASAAAVAAPPVPEGAVDGEVVEVDGELYEVRGDELVPFGEEPLPEEAPPGDSETTPDDEGAGDEPAAPGDEPSPPVPQEIQVTSSRVDRGARATVGAEVIDNDRITETGARNLADLLERTPGMSVTNSIGTGQEVSVDGLDPKHVLILIDGRPVNGRVNDRVDVSRLPISAADVDRVEIVRGPMSAVYGSEALGGVVNIITRRPKPGATGSVELGTRISRFGAARNALSASGSANVGDLLLKGNGSLTLERATDRGARDSDGNVTDEPDGQLDTPHRRQATIGAEAGYFLGDLYLRGWANGSYNEVETRVSNVIPFRDHAMDLQGQAGIGVDVDLPMRIKLNTDLRVDRYVHQFEKLPDAGESRPPPFCEDKDAGGLRVFDPACPAPPNVRSVSTQDQVRLDVHASQQPANEVFGFALPSWAGEIGWASGTVQQLLLVERLNGDGEDTLPGGGFLWVGSLYAEGVWRPWSFLSLVPGVRGDLVAGDLLAGNVGPKMSARLDLPAGLALRGSYGRGFRVPSFQERLLRFDHSDLGYIVEGSPDLVPETSDGARAELVWQAAERVRVSAEGYFNLLNNLIAEQPVRTNDEGIPVYVYQNVTRAYTSGINFRLEANAVAGFSFVLGYQYLLAAADASGCPENNPWFCSEDEGLGRLPLRPTHSGNLSLRYLVAPTGTTLFSRVDFMDDRPIDATTSAPGYVRVGAGVQQPLLDHLFFTFTLDNLLDSYDPVYGPKPGRHATLSLRGSL